MVTEGRVWSEGEDVAKDSEGVVRGREGVATGRGCGHGGRELSTAHKK